MWSGFADVVFLAAVCVVSGLAGFSAGVLAVGVSLRRLEVLQRDRAAADLRERQSEDVQLADHFAYVAGQIGDRDCEDCIKIGRGQKMGLHRRGPSVN
jgi:hypothetical protein